MRWLAPTAAPLLRCWAEAALLSIALGALGCSGSLGSRRDSPSEAADPMLIATGAELFTTYCASCHGVDARGDGPAAPALITPPPDLTRIAARRGGEFSEASIARKIDGRFDLPAHGSREMPVWGAHLAEDMPDMATGEEVARGRIASLVEYLKSVQID